MCISLPCVIMLHADQALSFQGYQAVWPAACALHELVGAGLAQKQRQVEAAVLEGEMTYNEALIEEREQGINEISQQIGEVNEIFQARGELAGAVWGPFACLLSAEQVVQAWLPGSTV